MGQHLGLGSAGLTSLHKVSAAFHMSEFRHGLDDCDSQGFFPHLSHPPCSFGPNQVVSRWETDYST